MSSPSHIPKPLAVTVRLLQLWQRSGISYCHWKSNQHLSEALAGETDLDILVAQKDAPSCEKALLETGFKQVLSPPWGQYPGISDWIGFDFDSGKLCHVHLHYKLLIGQKFVKNIHLPLESWLLTHTQDQEGAQVPEPERELILLILRVLLKTTWWQLLCSKWTQKQPFPKNIQRELDWLLQRSDPNKIPERVKEAHLSFPPSFFLDFIRHFHSNTLSSSYMLPAQKILRTALKNYQRQTPLQTVIDKAWAVFSVKILTRFGIPKKKILSKSGKYFALVGCDGSGKTTLAKDLEKWLSWKIEAKPAYFGIPKKSWIKKLLLLCRLPFLALSKIVPFAKMPAQFLEDLWWLCLASQRKHLHAQCLQHKKMGLIVIAERFPMKEFWAMKDPMDGPRIRNAILSPWEKKMYSSIGLPDEVYILQAGLESLRKRKNDLDLETQKIKADAVNGVPPQKGYHFVQAEKPYPEVLLEIKRLIWKSL